MKILFLTYDFPLPCNHGNRMRTWNFINSLKDENELSLLCFDRDDISNEQMREAKKVFSNIWLVKRESEARNKCRSFVGKAKKLLSFLRLQPWEIQNTFLPEYEKRFLELLKNNDFDILFARYIYMGQYLIKNRRAISSLKILDVDDMEFVKRQEIRNKCKDTLYGRHRTRVNNTFLKYYYKKGALLDKALLCSDSDKNVLRLHNAVVVPNALDEEIGMKVPAFTKENIDNKTILFCGHLSYDANVDGILWFVTSVFKRLQSLDNSVKLHIVGLQPEKCLLECADGKSIYVFKDVESVMPFYNNCSLVIAPLRFGGGTRIKLLEAMAYKRPIVTTHKGAEGLDLVNGRHCLFVDGPEDFSKACYSILTGYDKAKLMTEEAYTLFKSKYSFEKVKNRINGAFRYA